MKRIALLGPLLIASTFVAGCAHGPVPRFDATDRAVMATGHFMGAHPDLRWRRAAVESLRDGLSADALVQFKRAARYADKPSQAMIAEMLWTGRGVPVNRPLAYAWMDIAAERGYIAFVAKREQYWAELSVEEKRKALEVGRPLYDEYNDTVAKPRLNRVLADAKRDITGSRTGFVGGMRVVLGGTGGIVGGLVNQAGGGRRLRASVDGEDYYAEKFWEPEQYWELQDEIWKVPASRVGTVKVRPLERVREEAGSGASSSDDDGS